MDVEGAAVWKPKQYECPFHGPIEEAAVTYSIRDTKWSSTYCMRCMIEFLDRNVSKATPA